MAPPSTAVPAAGLPVPQAEPEAPSAGAKPGAEQRPARLAFVADEKKTPPQPQKPITPDWVAISEAMLSEVGRGLAGLAGLTSG